MQCPYCPREEVTATITKAITSAKTIIDKEKSSKIIPNETEAAGKAQTKTVIDKKTIILESSEKNDEKNALPAKKLVGWLVSFDLDPAGMDFKIFEGRTKIGRNSTNNIVINNPEISEEHVLLLCRDNKLIIQDQLSENGTFVNGEKIDERFVIKDNDSIKLGSISFKLKTIL
jgi:hypothetical protein